MDLAKFISKIYDLPSLNQDDYPLLVELSDKYPWFGTAHLLQAKCLNNQNKYGYKQSLKKAAIYTGNRTVLYDMMHDIGFFIKPVVQPKAEVHTAVELTKEGVDTIDTAVTKIESNDFLIPEIEATVEVNKTEESPMPLETIIVTENLEVKEIDISRNEVLHVTEEINVELPVEPITVETKEPNEKEPSVDDFSDKLPDWQHITVYDPERELQKLVAPKFEENSIEDQSIPEQKEIVKHDFLNWLDQVKQPTEEIAIRQPRKLPMSEESKRLLESFIKNRPSTNRLNQIKSVENSSDNHSQSSKIELVSETLAKLYLKQNLPEKALEVYKKLQLQNPQKLTYFAALIEEVEKIVAQTHLR